MIEVDPSFQQGRKNARSRRNRRLAQRLSLFVGMPLICLTAAGYFWFDLPTLVQTKISQWRTAQDADLSLVQMESDIVVAPVVQVNAFLDIPGDPTILLLPEADAEDGPKVVNVMGPGVLDIARFGLPSPDRITVLRDDLVVTERRLMTALPSSREDFAFFQAQQNTALQASVDAGTLVALESLDTTVDLGDLDDSYGAELDLGQGDTAPAPETSAAEIEAQTSSTNNTSVSFIRREADRARLFTDTILRLETDQPLADILADAKLSAADIERLTVAIPPLIAGADTLQKGAIVALRKVPGPGGQSMAQLSVYAPTGYLGTVAQGPTGDLVPASDPWINDRLLELAGEDANPEPAQGEYRFLDAVYSSAVRNGVPTTLVGEFVTVLSRGLDLERPAKTGDTVTLIFARQHGPNGKPAGQLLFAGFEGPSGSTRCYVVQDDVDGGYRCFVPGTPGLPQPGSGAQFVTPTTGILTSKFGPRKHPILKTLRLHAGVDWAAPTGTEVRAAAAGRISHAGDGQGYGNLVIIAHPDGLETRYAHLNRFAPTAKKDAVVQAGELIGYIGTTGLSTGPHLHFETRLNGEPVDPMTYLHGGTPPVAASGAVDALVNQIIKVESGGNATAKNPLSSATGLGQFIESTWLRMMQSYRPNLVSTMSRAELLALRNDPTISREMVTRLAQENENYLRSRGHGINPGVLYLAHFLGPEGANKVLSAGDGQTILAVMGGGVVKANPFLAKYTVADLKAWSARKMSKATGGVAIVNAAPAPPSAPLDPKVQLFVDLVDEVLKEAG